MPVSVLPASRAPFRGVRPASRFRRALPVLPAFLAAILAASPWTAARAASGAELYAQQCAMCHQADLKGLAGQYPPLGGRVDKIMATPEGRHYLADLLTHGMSGPIQAGGAAFAGYMPAFKQLSDSDIAAILDYVSDQGGTKPAPHLDAAEIAAARGRPLNVRSVLEERGALDAAHKLP
ncbi:c-type cytochrome [Rhizosaccharibacter radicis]|uniref:Cytochrome c n=1 Tax=Rhizosaccharibacter radicis TaxID=2782605 RepID=A0ABT1W377_9PROT|nr:cytochrome c [Acetobacteraceae bacterium KSS12]